MMKSLYAVALCAAAVVPAYAATPDPIEEEVADSQLFTDIRIVSDAEMYYDKNGLHYPLADLESLGQNYRAICDSASAVLSLFPDDSDALATRAVANYYLGDMEQSVSDAMRTFDMGYDSSSDVLYAVADKDADLVMRYLTPHTEAYLAAPDPANVDDAMPGYLTLLAHLYALKGDRMKAYDVTRIAVDIDDQSDDNLIYLSTLLMDGGNADKALKLLKPYIDESDVYYSGILHNYLLALRDTGKSDKAFKLFEKAIDADTFNDNTRLQYATMLAANGEFDKALAILDRIVENWKVHLEYGVNDEFDPMTDEARLRRGIIRSLTNDTEAAMEDLNVVLTNSLKQKYPTGFEAICYAYLGDKAKAEEWLNKYDSVRNSNKASVYAVLGDYDTAFRYLKQSFDSFETCPDQTEYDLNFSELRKLPAYKKLIKAYRKMEVK